MSSLQFTTLLCLVLGLLLFVSGTYILFGVGWSCLAASGLMFTISAILMKGMSRA